MRKLLFLCLLFPVMGLVVACGGDDDDDWKSNSTDVAVTGNPSAIGFSAATIDGLVNLDQKTASESSVYMYVEYTDDFTVDIGMQYASSERIEEIGKGNKVSCTISYLEPGTKYYYRIKVSVNGTTYTGEIRSFTTMPISDVVASYKITGTSKEDERADASFTLKNTPDVAMALRKGYYGIRTFVAYSPQKDKVQLYMKGERGIENLRVHDFYFSESEYSQNGSIADHFYIPTDWWTSGKTIYYCTYTILQDGEYDPAFGSIGSFNLQ